MKNWKLPLIIAVIFVLIFAMSGCGKEGNYKENEQKIDYTIRTMIYFHTAPKLFERKMYGENGWKYSEEYLEIFKKIIYFYRTEIYDKIPE